MWKQNGAATRKKHPGGGKKKPGRCPKPEPLMDPGRAAQTPEAKRRKIKRHAGQMPDAAWPSQGQPKMVGKNKGASHCRSKKRPPRKGRRQRRPEEIYVAIPAGVRQAIRQRPKLKQRAQHGAAAQHGPSSYAPARRFPATKWARLRRLQQRGWCEPRLGPPPAPKRPWFQSPWGGGSRAGLRMHQLCPGAGACRHHMPPQQKCVLNHQGRPTAGVPWRQSQVQLGVQGRTGETHPQGGGEHWLHHQVVVGEAGQPSHAQGEDILVRPNCEPGHEGRCGEVYAPHQPCTCRHGTHACPEWHRIWGTMCRQQLLQCPDGPGSQPRTPLAPCVCGRTAHRSERPEHQALPPTTTWLCQRRKLRGVGPATQHHLFCGWGPSAWAPRQRRQWAAESGPGKRWVPTKRRPHLQNGLTSSRHEAQHIVGHKRQLRQGRHLAHGP